MERQAASANRFAALRGELEMRLGDSATALGDHRVLVGWVAPERRLGRSQDIAARLLRNADLALLCAEVDPTMVVQYCDELSPPAVAEERLRRELIQSIDDGLFVVHFQPEVDLATGRLVGAEALLRRSGWREEVEPAIAFIGDLERLGLMTRLTDLVLDQAEDFATRWAALGPFTIRVNFGADELNEAALRRRLAVLPAGDSITWCIEITERTIESLDIAAVDALSELAHDGIEIALDDFGTGYSSMAELQRLPITTLKIDRSFVHPLRDDIDGVSVASLIHDVATRLGLNVVAEGIETKSQQDALCDLGCQRGQGWLIAPAMPANDFVLWAQGRASLERSE